MVESILLGLVVVPFQVAFVYVVGRYFGIPLRADPTEKELIERIIKDSEGDATIEWE